MELEKFKWIFSGITGIVAQFMGKYGLIIGLVCGAMVFDVCTGVIKARAIGEPITSKKGTKGFWKKLALLTGLFFGIFLDAVAPVLLNLGLGVTLPFGTPFGLVIGMYIVLNESISVVENLYQVNENIIPKFVADFLRLATEQLDNDSKEG